MKLETSFQKNNIGWPQQPPTEKEKKFKIIHHDSTKKYFVQNIKIKLNSRTSEVLSSDFPGLKTSAASLTSSAFAASLASTTSTAQFHQGTS